MKGWEKGREMGKEKRGSKIMTWRSKNTNGIVARGNG